jgi:hypothetical protein
MNPQITYLFIEVLMKKTFYFLLLLETPNDFIQTYIKYIVSHGINHHRSFFDEKYRIRIYVLLTAVSIISKTLTLRVPSNTIYLALKDTRLEKLFPEFFIGVKRRLAVDKTNRKLTFRTVIQGSQIEIIETIRLKISGNNTTEVEYITETNKEEDNLVAQSIIQTHIANILYSLLMLETGYINGLIKRKNE